MTDRQFARLLKVFIRFFARHFRHEPSAPLLAGIAFLFAVFGFALYLATGNVFSAIIGVVSLLFGTPILASLWRRR